MLPTNIVQLSYGVPGVLAYFVVGWAMYGVRRVLNRSFIVIFLIAAVINIATWLNTWVCLRFQRDPSFFGLFEWLNEHPNLSNISNLLISEFYYAQNVCLLLLTIDRFVVIMSIRWDTTWWHRFYIPFVFVAHLIGLALNLLAWIPYHGTFVIDKLGHYDWKFDMPSYNNRQRATLIQLFFGIAVFVVCSLLNALSLRELVRLRKLVSVSKEMSFLLISFCIFVAQVLNLCIMISMSVISASEHGSMQPFYRFINDVMFFTSDTFSIGPAFYTLLLPSPIRRFVTRRLKEALKHCAKTLQTRYSSAAPSHS